MLVWNRRIISSKYDKYYNLSKHTFLNVIYAAIREKTMDNLGKLFFGKWKIPIFCSKLYQIVENLTDHQSWKKLKNTNYALSCRVMNLLLAETARWQWSKVGFDTF
jgi:hypothetical protein